MISPFILSCILLMQMNLSAAKPKQSSSSSSATPTPSYSYAYTAAVGSPVADGLISAKEWRRGSVVTGSYSLLDTDGRERQVVYRADSSGFSATVETNEVNYAENPANVVYVFNGETAASPSTPSTSSTSSQQSKAKPKQSSSSSSSSSSATPTPSYSYAYTAAVGSPVADGLISAKEWRRGSVVTGSYSLLDTDGRERQVVYRADNSGFSATVETNEVNYEENPANVVYVFNGETAASPSTLSTSSTSSQQSNY